MVSRGAAMQGAKENIRKKSREDKRRQGGGLSATRNAGKLSPFPPHPEMGSGVLASFMLARSNLIIWEEGTSRVKAPPPDWLVSRPA